MLSTKQVQDVCLYGLGHQQCRYLDEPNYGDPNNNTFKCLKKTRQKQEHDQQVDECIEECKRRNINPNSLGLPMGNNCSGYLPFTSLIQGYDQD